MLKPRPKAYGASRSKIAIKRVIRVGNSFTCGVCRRTYGREAEAEACLSRCLGGHLNPSTPVTAEAGGKRFRCHFCKRVYSSREDAKGCASACRASAQESVNKEKDIKAKAQQASAGAALDSSTRSAGDSGTQPQKTRTPVRRDQEHKYLREGRTLVCRKCGKEFQNLDGVIQCYDSHPATVKKPKASAPSPSPAAPKVPKEKSVAQVSNAPVSAGSGAKPQADDDSKFMRDGAKYVCRQCHQKYFTRDDVLKCFDGHGNESKEPGTNGAEDGGPSSPQATVAKGGDDDSKFFRDGAKYVCRGCQKKYFTRGEVVQCFDGHGANEA